LHDTQNAIGCTNTAREMRKSSKSVLVQVYVAVCCSVLQCVAVCCSVLQCVAVCCSGMRREHLIPPKNLLVSGVSTPYTPFVLICTISSELTCILIFTHLGEPWLISAGFQWTTSTPAEFLQIFRAAYRGASYGSALHNFTEGQLIQ